MTDDLKQFIDRGWNDHVDDDAGVALRLPHALDHVTDAQGMTELARLAEHVYAEHLGRWADGLKYLAALARMPVFDPHSADGQALRRMRAGMALAAGESDVRATLDEVDRIAVTARAAMVLALHDAARSRQLLDEALAQAAAAAGSMDGDNPATRALAVAGNNIASSLQQKAARSDAERALMIHAAEVARRWWAVAGTWLETERAEYRLAMVCLVDGDAKRAREHARACLAIVDAQATPQPLESFFGHEALALAEQALGHTDAQARSVAAARHAFEQLGADDQEWCRPTLDKL